MWKAVNLSPFEYRGYPQKLPGRPLPGREPLRTMRELAAEFGVGLQSLANMVAADPNGPRPKRADKHRRTDKTYYSPSEVRRWWRNRLNSALK